MSVRMICAGLVLATLFVVVGCHSQSGYRSACCGQPNVVAASPVAPCNNCPQQPVAAVPAVPGFAP
jgi:hypothetical protein